MRSFHFLHTLVLFGICAWLVPIQAQRVGGSASGGSVRPENTRKFQVKAQPSPSPTVSPTPGPFYSITTPKSRKEECDDATVNGKCPGTFAFTYGFNAGMRPRAGGAQSAKGGFSFWVYLTKRVFVQLDSDNFVTNKDSNDTRVSGTGDNTAYIAADLLLEKKKIPAVTLYYGLKFPTASASKGIGTGEYDHTILGVVGKTFGKSYLESDTGVVFARDPVSKAFKSYPFTSIIEEQALNDRWLLHFEIGGTIKASGYEGDAYNLNYAQVQVSKHALIRFGGKFGITDNVPKAGIYLALRFQGNLARRGSK